MNENEMTLAIVRAICAAFAVVIACVAGCVGTTTVTQNQAIAAMVAGGADPVAARCPFVGGDREIAACAVLAAKR